MKTMYWLPLAGLAVAVGCGADESPPTSSADIRSNYVAAVEPVDAIPVGQLRESADDQQAVTLVGIIGGSTEPFVEGIAAFTVVDPKVPYCAPDEGCPTPWDYCCTQNQVANNIATVKIVDQSGNLVEGDARLLTGAKELSTVVVQGTAGRDGEGNLTVTANKVFVRSGE